jgi:hypothetical protein
MRESHPPQGSSPKMGLSPYTIPISSRWPYDNIFNPKTQYDQQYENISSAATEGKGCPSTSVVSKRTGFVFQMTSTAQKYQAGKPGRIETQEWTASMHRSDLRDSLLAYWIAPRFWPSLTENLQGSPTQRAGRSPTLSEYYQCKK